MECIVRWHQDLGIEPGDRIFAPIQDLGDRAVKPDDTTLKSQIL
ncbi:MAG: hypothetical protein U7126_12580 [Microcoleus sp.]